MHHARNAAAAIILAGSAVSLTADITYFFEGTITEACITAATQTFIGAKPVIGDTWSLEFSIDETATTGLNLATFPPAFEYLDNAITAFDLKLNGNTLPTSIGNQTFIEFSGFGGVTTLVMTFVVGPFDSLALRFENVPAVPANPYPEQSFFDAASDISMVMGPGTPMCLLAGQDLAFTGGVVDDTCFADCDGSGSLLIDDIECFANAFISGDLAGADCDGNGSLQIDDIECFADSFLGGCP